MKSNKSHKKNVIFGIIGGVLLAAAIAILLVVLGSTKPNNIEKFELSNDLYGNGQLLDITAEDFNQFVSEKKSFLVMAHLAVCPAEMPLTDTSKHLAKQENLTIYSIDNDEFKKIKLFHKFYHLNHLLLNDVLL